MIPNFPRGKCFNWQRFLGMMIALYDALKNKFINLKSPFNNFYPVSFIFQYLGNNLKNKFKHVEIRFFKGGNDLPRKYVTLISIFSRNKEKEKKMVIQTVRYSFCYGVRTCKSPKVE